MDEITQSADSRMQTSRFPSLIAIVGQTASGKSAVAAEVARQFSGEIINADSWQIYKHMDVGTAKPSQREREEIPHHLIDIVEPDAEFTAAVYKRMATEAIEDIASRGKLPIMVGGTGLYIDGVLFDYSFAPQGYPGQREALREKSIPELLELIQQRGIDLSGIDTRNKRRLMRLLETNGVKPERADLRGNTLVLGVTTSRNQLRENIEKRTEAMFRAGLKHEVRELAERYGWQVEAMKGIGYREFKPYFEGEQSLAETKRQITKNTLELAKKQRTWFKRNRHIQWVESVEEAKESARQFV
ncbi:tRNA (adenosine(37)-N6)-dimethylallyltransferase MiaA [Candidatus Saccharibacteria bacterium QS_5_54_17]|nr:MAG: tRNA (adenosine(37)-N6)-dimethylallyltransferase MiaA [Candidatus Saccharibacteria bacterium QS_5_54_17]